MTARFTEQWVRPAATIVPWQRADLLALGLTREQCAEAIQWVSDGVVLSGPAAAGAALRSGVWVWRPLGWLLRLPLVERLAWPFYRWVSRNRHRLPGGTPACAIK